MSIVSLHGCWSLERGQPNGTFYLILNLVCSDQEGGTRLHNVNATEPESGGTIPTTELLFHTEITNVSQFAPYILCLDCGTII